MTAGHEPTEPIHPEILLAGLEELVRVRLTEILGPGVRLDQVEQEDGTLVVTLASTSPEASRRVEQWCSEQGFHLREE